MVDVARKLIADVGILYYGMELQSMLKIRPGTLYPILARFRNAGWIVDQWEDPAVALQRGMGPVRCYYQVTGKGAYDMRVYVNHWDSERSNAPCDA